MGENVLFIRSEIFSFLNFYCLFIIQAKRLTSLIIFKISIRLRCDQDGRIGRLGSPLPMGTHRQISMTMTSRLEEKIFHT